MSSIESTHFASEETNAEQRKKRRERHRIVMRRIRQGLLALAVLGFGVFAVLAMRPKPVPVDVVTVHRGALEVVIEESGTTRVKDRFVVSAPVAGTASRISLEPGDSVQEGDALAEIAPALSPLLDERARAQNEARLGAALSAFGQAETQVSRAEVAKELADRELERTRKLARAGTFAPTRLEKAEFEAKMRAEELGSARFAQKVAKEEVRSARAALGKDQGRSSAHHIEVLAPASGVVLRVHHESAGVVPAGAPLIEVGDPTALELVVDLLTTDAVNVGSGTPVVVTGWGGRTSLEGRVRRVEPSGFTRPSALGVDEQRVNVIVVLTEPEERWKELGDNFRAEARIVLWKSDDILKVPHGAVFRHGDGWAVYRVEDGQAVLTPVEVGHRGETEVEIVSGLQQGLSVAVHPGDRVKDGVRVSTRSSD